MRVDTECSTESWRGWGLVGSGFFHFFGAAAEQSVPLLNAFLYRMLHVVPEGTWDQEEWLSFHKRFWYAGTLR